MNTKTISKKKTTSIEETRSRQALSITQSRSAHSDTKRGDQQVRDLTQHEQMKDNTKRHAYKHTSSVSISRSIPNSNLPLSQLPSSKPQPPWFPTPISWLQWMQEKKISTKLTTTENWRSWNRELALRNSKQRTREWALQINNDYKLQKQVQILQILREKESERQRSHHEQEATDRIQCKVNALGRVTRTKYKYTCENPKAVSSTPRAKLPRPAEMGLAMWTAAI
jgi:hypothetical protein